MKNNKFSTFCALLSAFTLSTSSSAVLAEHHDQSNHSNPSVSYRAKMDSPNLSVPRDSDSVDDTSSLSTSLSSATRFPINMIDYFSNLRQNFGYNQMGSCTYVALGMLLTYYDTFTNDNIVPEAYDVISSGDTAQAVISNSPGSVFEALSTSSNSAYSSAILNKKDTNLMTRLIYEEYKATGSWDFSTHINSFQTILNGFFSSNSSLKPTVTYQFGSDSTIRSLAISKINQGIPVVLTIKRDPTQTPNGSDDYHSVVAYDYNTTDGIIAHFGWGASTTHSSLVSQSYVNIDGIAYLDFDLDHVHSNNYKVGTTYYCPDGTDPYAHVHSFTYRIRNSNQHTAICDCGYTSIQLHTFRLIPGEPMCFQCGMSNPNSGVVLLERRDDYEM